MTLGGSTPIVKTQVYAQDTQPTDERDGVIWVDTSATPRDTYVYSADSASWELVNQPQPIAAIDETRTFAESGVSVTHSTTRTVGESVELGGVAGTGATYSGGSSSGATTVGMDFTPTTDLIGFEVTAAAENGGTYPVALKDSGGTTLDSQSLAPGETGTFYGDLSSGVEYRIDITTSGGTYQTTGSTDGDGEYFTASGTWVDGIDAAAGVVYASSGSVAVGWPEPADVFAWDRATFQATANGGTADVYIEESADGGSTWTTIAGPISRGQEITADPANRCRLRVDLGRGGPSSSPTVEALARRYVL